MLLEAAKIAYVDELYVSRDWGYEIWLKGIGLNLFGATLTAVGLLLQKSSHKKQLAEEEEKEKVQDAGASSSATAESSLKKGSSPAPLYFTQHQWLLGIGVYIVGSLLCWLGLGMSSQTILSCLNCWSMVVSFALAPLFLGESLSLRRALGVLLLICGCLCSVAYGPRVADRQTLGTLHEAWVVHKSLRVILLFSLIFLLIAGSWDHFFPVRTEGAGERRRASPLAGLRYVAMAAVLGWYSVLMAKCTSSLVLTTFSGAVENQILKFGFWMILIAQLVVILGNLHFLNLGLQRTDAVVVVPVYEAMGMTGQILLGGIFFDELLRDSMTTTDLFRFWGGFAVVLVGIFTLAVDSAKNSKGDDSEEEVLPLLAPLKGKTPQRVVRHYPRLREGVQALAWSGAGPLSLSSATSRLPFSPRRGQVR